MTKCKDCKHFNAYEEEWSGWCDIKLPTWLYRATNINRYEVIITVRADDACDLGVNRD